jgi:hypothetical protein
MSTKFQSIITAVFAASAALLSSSSASAESRAYEPGYEELRLFTSCKDDLGEELLEDVWSVPLQEDALPAGALDDARALIVARIKEAGRPEEEQEELFHLADDLFTSLQAGLGAAMIAYPDRIGVTELDKCAPMMPVLVGLRDDEMDQEFAIETLEDCATGELSLWFELDVEDLHGAPLLYLDDPRITPMLLVNEQVRVGALDVSLSASGHADVAGLTCSIWSSVSFILQ